MRKGTVDGVDIPLLFTSLEEEVHAIRNCVALSDQSQIQCFRMVGDDAYDVLDAICPIPLLMRDGQIRHTLWLDESAHPIADLFLCNDDEEYILLLEGLTAKEAAERLEAAIPDDADCALIDLNGSRALLSLNGPFAWELMARYIGPESVGFPYLSFFHPSPEVTFFRAGKTGEYSYDLLIPMTRKEEVWQELLSLGQEFDMKCAGWEALQVCMGENCFFQPHQFGPDTALRDLELTPLELQMQWRISYDKEYPGAQILRQRRQQGIQRRTTAICSPHPIEGQTPIFLEREQVGVVLFGLYSPTRKQWIGQALLDIQWAHAGIDAFTLGDEALPMQTVSAPFVNNLSLYINPQQHSYKDR